MQRLKTSEIRSHRQSLVQSQNFVCPLCEQPLDQQQAVLDHRHSDGRVRQAIHRFCNTFLGKIENNITRNQITPVQLEAILRNYSTYVNCAQELLHPSYWPPEQRQQQARLRAQRRRQRAKTAKTPKKPQ